MPSARSGAIALHEPYRTLLGHFRHEIGHYYWDRLIRDAERLEAFRDAVRRRARRLRQALQAALRARAARRTGRTSSSRAYASDAPVGGLGRDVGALPAHDRHAGDRRRLRRVAPPAAARTNRRSSDVPTRSASTDALVRRADRRAGFRSPTCSTTSIAASGMADGYPFVLSAPAIEKLRFVHDTVHPS